MLVEDKIGTLQADRYADIIGVAGNPLDDLFIEFQSS